MNVNEALNRLLASPKFADFEGRDNDLAILEIAGFPHKETAHTKLLAWLLNPKTAHGLGAVPLKSFLHMAWAARKEGSESQALSPVEVDQIPDLEDVTVAAEFTLTGSKAEKSKGRADVFAYSGTKESPKPLMLVEYKVYAEEGDEQTTGYAEWIDRRVGDAGKAAFKPSLIFLTRDGGEPQDPRFVPVSYAEFGTWLRELDRFKGRPTAWKVIEELERCVGLCTEQIETIEGMEREIDVLIANAALEEVKNIDQRHDAAFRRLGIISGNAYESAVLNAVSKIISDLDKPNDHKTQHWREANRSAMTFWSRDLFRARNTVFAPQTDKEELWGYLEMQDPVESEAKHAVLEFGIGTSVPELKGEINALAADLRNALAFQGDGKIKIGKAKSRVIAKLLIETRGTTVDTEAIKTNEDIIKRFVVAATNLLQDGLILERLREWKRKQDAQAAAPSL